MEKPQMTRTRTAAPKMKCCELFVVWPVCSEALRRRSVCREVTSLNEAVCHRLCSMPVAYTHTAAAIKANRSNHNFNDPFFF